MVLNGTREGLYNACIALCPETKNGKQPIVLMPNPFYQVYAVAAVTVGAEPLYVPATAATGFLPDYAGLPPEILDRVTIAYLCSPANPQGAVASADYWKTLLALAEKHDFTIFADECYSEIWRNTAPTGILEVAQATNADPERVFTFHSLSKRSNLPGLRSGFVAGGAKGIAQIRKLRSFAGAPLPLPIQKVSEAAWNDDASRRSLPRALSREIRRGGPRFSRPTGLQNPRRRLLSLAARRRWRASRTESMARNRRSGAARCLPLARCKRGKPRQRLYSGRLGGPQRRNAARADPTPRLPLRLRTG